jgi:hypothetical protein
MIPIDQTIPFEAGSVVLGNCLQACVASIHELPIEAVPHFVQFENFGEALRLWLDGRGFALVERATLKHPDIAPWQPGVPILAFGKSPRGGWAHSVVWQDGDLLHDPHPSHDGLDGEPYELWDITVKKGSADV